MRVDGQRHASAALPPGKTRYRLFRRLDGPQGRSGRVRKISPPPGFDPRTVQPVASRYTDWANPADPLSEVLTGLSVDGLLAWLVQWKVIFIAYRYKHLIRFKIASFWSHALTPTVKQFLYVLLIVRLIVFVNNQLDAQFFFLSLDASLIFGRFSHL